MKVRTGDRAGAVGLALHHLAPALPAREHTAVLENALASRGLRRAAPETAAWLSLVAYARHCFTDYDALIRDGYDRAAARHFTLAATEATLAAWGCRHPVGAGLPPGPLPP